MAKENFCEIIKQFKETHESVSDSEKNDFLIKDRYGKYKISLIKNKGEIGVKISDVYVNSYNGKKITGFLITLQVDSDGNFIGVSNPETERPGFCFTFKYKEKNYDGIYEQDLMTDDTRLTNIDGRYWRICPHTETQQNIAKNMKLPILVDPYATVFKLLTQNVSSIHIANNPFVRPIDRRRK